MPKRYTVTSALPYAPSTKPFSINIKRGFLLGFFLILCTILFIIGLDQLENTRFEELKTQLCQQSSLSPNDLLQLYQLLNKKEGISISDIDDLKNYLCNAEKNYNFPDEKHLANLLKINLKDIHLVKKEILNDAKMWLKKLGANNPDIGLNKITGKIVLKNRINQKTIETDLLFKDFIRD